MTAARRTPTTSRTRSAARARRPSTASRRCASRATPSATTTARGNDDYTQAGNLFRLLGAEQQQRLFRNLAAAMQGVPEAIVRRQLMHFARADRRYAEWVAAALGLSLEKAAA